MDTLEDAVQAELSKGIECVDTHELGEVIDMIKDCCKGMYYYTAYKAMKEEMEEEEEAERCMHHKMWPMAMLSGMSRDMDVGYGRMYYPDKADGMQWTHSKHGEAYDKYMDEIKKHPSTDPTHKSERIQMMEEYTQDLSKAISNILEDISPEEKAMLRSKLMKMAGTMQ